MNKQLKFTAKVWLYDGPAGWHFVTVPVDLSSKIKASNFGSQKAFGSVAIVATIGNTSWKTSVFPDSKAGAYLLPIKAAVRRKEKIQIGAEVQVALEVVT